MRRNYRARSRFRDFRGSTPGRRSPPSWSARIGSVAALIAVAPFLGPSPRYTCLLLLHDPEKLRPEERTYREILFNRDPEIAAARALAANCSRLIAKRDGAAPTRSVKRAIGSVFPEFRAFVTVLDRNRVAFESAFTLEWSIGQTGGQIHGPTLVKRQMDPADPWLCSRSNFSRQRSHVHQK